MWAYEPTPSPDEIYHHGVKGMKWGVRKKYITVRQATKNANEAYKKSLYDDKARSKDLRKQGKKGITIRQATKNANQAYKDSFKKDKAYNKDLRQQKKNDKAKNASANPNKKREIAIAATAVAGTALAAYGTYKVSKFIKDRHIARSISKGHQAAERFLDNGGKAYDALTRFREDIDYASGKSTSQIIKSAISNNSVGSKVKWDGVYKTLMNK